MCACPIADLQPANRYFWKNKAAVDKNPYAYVDRYDPNRIYWRLFLRNRTGEREFGKWSMDFSQTDKALDVCKKGMVDVSTAPLRQGESINKKAAGLHQKERINKKASGLHQKKPINWYARLKQDAEYRKWRFFFPKALTVEQDRPPLWLTSSK